MERTRIEIGKEESRHQTLLTTIHTEGTTCSRVI